MYTPWFWIINLNQVTMCWGWTLWESEYWTSAVREKILTSIIQNVKNNVKHWNITFHAHCFFWSNGLVVMALDSQFRGLMFKTIKAFFKKKLKCSVPDTIACLKKIITLYCSTEVHIIQKYTNQKEEDTSAYTWQRYESKLKYLPKIAVSRKKNSKKSLKAISGLYWTEINEVKLA